MILMIQPIKNISFVNQIPLTLFSDSKQGFSLERALNFEYYYYLYKETCFSSGLATAWAFLSFVVY
jgi:hypothetical protein